MKRPKLGQRVTATDSLVRTSQYKPYVPGVNNQQHTIKEWKRSGDRLAPAPVAGLFIGYRQYFKGRRVWNGDTYVFLPDENFEVWLIVPDERRNPVPVLPEDCTITPEGEK